MKNRGSPIFPIRLTGGQREQWEAIAKHHGLPIAEMVKKLVDQEFERIGGFRVYTRSPKGEVLHLKKPIMLKKGESYEVAEGLIAKGAKK